MNVLSVTIPSRLAFFRCLFAISLVVLSFVLPFIAFGDINSGLVAYYPFNGNANDASGNGNNGTVYGAAYETYGAGQTALHFSGTAATYVVVPRSASLEPQDAITISLWCQGIPGTGQQYGTILRKADNCSEGYYIRTADSNSSGIPETFRLDLSNPCAGGSSSVVAFTTSTGLSWQHLVATYSSNDGLRTYVNGVLVSQAPPMGQLLHSGDLFIGGATVHDQDGGFNGLINEVRIYNRALSASEIQLLYSGASGSSVPVIVGAQAQQKRTSLNLPEGCKLYVYGMTTGGGFPSRPFAEGKSVHVENASGNASAEISVTKKNINSFTTDCGYYVIGGFGASDFHHVQGFYGSNPGPAATSASVQITLVVPAMISVLGVASSQTALTLSGIDNLVTDVPVQMNTPGTEALTIAHGYVGPGTYTIQENTGSGIDGEDPNHQVDLLGVFVFSDTPNAAQSDNPEIPLSLSPQSSTLPTVTIPNTPPTPSNGGENKPIGRYVILGVGVLVFIALAVAIIRMIIPRRNGGLD
jgi:hypothetical protein